MPDVLRTLGIGGLSSFALGSAVCMRRACADCGYCNNETTGHVWHNRTHHQVSFATTAFLYVHAPFITPDLTFLPDTIPVHRGPACCHAFAVLSTGPSPACKSASESQGLQPIQQSFAATVCQLYARNSARPLSMRAEFPNVMNSTPVPNPQRKHVDIK